MIILNYSGKDKKAQDESNTSDKYIKPVEKDNADITYTKGQDNLENNNQVNNNYDTQGIMEYKSNNENPNMLSNSLKKEQGGLYENGNNIEIVGEENIESDISSKDTNKMKIQNYNDDKENEDTINDVNNYNNEVYKLINKDNIHENEKIIVGEDEEEDMTHDINNEYDEEHCNNIGKRKAKRKSYNNNNNNYYTYKHHNNDYYNNNNNNNNIYGEKNYHMEHNKNSIELHKIKNKELDKGKKNKGKNNNTNNKSKNKFFFLFRKKGSIASSSHDKENEYIMKSNKNKNENFFNKDDQFVKNDDNQNLDISYNNNNNNNNNTNLDREKVMNLINKYNNIKKKNSEQNTIYNNSSITNTIKTSEYDVEKNDLNIQNDENICSRENRIYSMKTDDNIIFEFQKEHMNDINYPKNISQITIKTNDDEKKKHENQLKYYRSPILENQKIRNTEMRWWLLTDEKIILARKYIFGPTIYDLECKFLEKLKKAGSFHLILLYAILVFLFISISLLLHILLKYKTVKKVQQIKYASFVLVNLALITLISSIFSINREYNIPLCVQNDGSSDICMDGKSTYLIRSSIILLIFSNLFFCKFINFVHNKSHTIEGSMV
ncbi:hypothetical protein PFDG_03802 [Plasmodium falciparum Dd2]|uniref:CCAAT-box DNA binding protein subunit B n=1 Tax=Plasmodium falciparum (isolate Dd2) TaxID=57267 RepID=A0A0L7M3X3_PLAF4|nr:hypothetical protein PFDG_03802 [Plasmodium falciparum Dd2]